MIDRHIKQCLGQMMKGVQVIGAAINLLVFVVAIELFAGLARVPVVPLAMGAALALLFNFGASSRFVFSDTENQNREAAP